MVEMKAINGNWIKLDRTMYNYFIRENGMGPGPYDIRVTDIFDSVIIKNGIESVEGGIIEGSSQFP